MHTPALGVVDGFGWLEWNWMGDMTHENNIYMDACILLVLVLWMVWCGRKSPHLLFTGGNHIHDDKSDGDIDNDIDDEDIDKDIAIVIIFNVASINVTLIIISVTVIIVIPVLCRKLSQPGPSRFDHQGHPFPRRYHPYQ